MINEPLGEVNVPQDFDLAREIIGKNDQLSKLK